MTRAFARKLCTEMNGPASANPIFTLAVMGACVPESVWFFSVSFVSSSQETEEAEEAPTFGRGSSLKKIIDGVL
jgi:hypothetical protein